MIGAIVGDIVGSRFEWDNRKTKDFELFVTRDDYVWKVSKGYTDAKSAYEAENKGILNSVVFYKTQRHKGTKFIS